MKSIPQDLPIICEGDNESDVILSSGLHNMIEPLKPLRIVVELPNAAVPHLEKFISHSWVGVPLVLRTW